MADDLTVTVHRDDRAAHVVVSGDLSAYTCHQVFEAVASLVHDGVAAVNLDFAGVEFMDSSGIQCLITAQRTALDAGAVVTVGAMSEKVKRVLDVVGLLESLGHEPG
jgi:anti-sigma B factor antagonist